jgi:hypothetical protein
MATYKQPQPNRNSTGENGYGGDQRIKLDDLNTSVGEFRTKPYKATKTDGIKIRGTGAATKGTKARGPMA